MVEEKRQTTRGLKELRLFLAFVLSLTVLIASSFFLMANEAIAVELHAVEQARQTEAIFNAETTDFTSQTYSEEDILAAQINHAGVSANITIPDSAVPLSSNLTTGSVEEGSLYNTAIAMFSLISMIILLVLLAARKQHHFQVIVLRTISGLFGLATVVIWALFDKFQDPTAAINGMSAWITLFFVLYVVTAVISTVHEVRLSKASGTQKKLQSAAA